MVESFLTRIANEVLDASERLSIRLEEGLTVLLNSSAFPTKKANSDRSARQLDNEFMDQDRIDDFDESPLQGIAKSVLGDIFQNQARPQTLIEHFGAFRSAINWTEPFILLLLGFQIVMLLVTLYVSRSGQSFGPRLALLIVIAVFVRLAEEINKVAAKHWKALATQNYFDQRGVFVSIFFCAPLLLDSFIMLVLLLRESSLLLVQVKAREIKKRRQQQSQLSSDKKDQ